ncbi:hypothetical protein VTN00DRAFT_2126 [Thermoascus crustaceus]|uniref:uncharacterized protein n=1 Tax=Thermoascus crustaceus TaxID=5088 RepID=UPI003742C74C
MDPRNIPGHDIDAAFEQARYGLHGPEYYGDGLRYGVANPLQPRSPFASGLSGASGARLDDMAGYNNEMELNERVRKTNLAVTWRITTSAIERISCRSLGTDQWWTASQLDRILKSYQLPFDTRTLLAVVGASSRGGEPLSPTRARHAKLQIPLEHLGAHRIVEHEKMKRSINMYREI